MDRFDEYRELGVRIFERQPDRSRVVHLKNIYGLDIALHNFPLDVRTFELDARFGETITLRVEILVPNRDTGEPIPIQFQESISSYAVDCYNGERSEALREFVYRALRTMLLHELDEAWHWKGARERDPHRNERPR